MSYTRGGDEPSGSAPETCCGQVSDVAAAGDLITTGQRLPKSCCHALNSSILLYSCPSAPPQHIPLTRTHKPPLLSPAHHRHTNPTPMYPLTHPQCHATDTCNTWVLCNRPSGCGAPGSCSAYLSRLPNATRPAQQLPVVTFGEFTWSGIGGCAADGRWPYRMCSLKRVADTTDPPIYGKGAPGRLAGWGSADDAQPPVQPPLLELPLPCMLWSSCGQCFTPPPHTACTPCTLPCPLPYGFPSNNEQSRLLHPLTGLKGAEGWIGGTITRTPAKPGCPPAFALTTCAVCLASKRPADCFACAKVAFNSVACSKCSALPTTQLRAACSACAARPELGDGCAKTARRA